jgi:hypothetical protein
MTQPLAHQARSAVQLGCHQRLWPLQAACHGDRLLCPQLGHAVQQEGLSGAGMLLRCWQWVLQRVIHGAPGAGEVEARSVQPVQLPVMGS